MLTKYYIVIVILLITMGFYKFFIGFIYNFFIINFSYYPNYSYKLLIITWSIIEKNLTDLKYLEWVLLLPSFLYLFLVIWLFTIFLFYQFYHFNYKLYRINITYYIVGRKVHKFKISGFATTVVITIFCFWCIYFWVIRFFYIYYIDVWIIRLWFEFFFTYRTIWLL